jgi:alpha-1,2-mannosyltransferase
MENHNVAQGETGTSTSTRLLTSRWVLVALPLVLAVATATVVLHYSGFIDTAVYQAGAQQLLRNASQLYEVNAPNGLPFTYPPFAAMIFVPLAALSPVGAGVVISAVSALCASRVGYITSRLAPVPVPAVGVALSLLVVEPGLRTLGYGQVNLLLMWLVFEGVLIGWNSGNQAWRAVLVGLAAGLKLIPLIFIGLLVLAREWRRAVWAVVGLIVSIGLGFVVAPGPSHQYWTELMFDDTRIGGVEYLGNQSINGLLWRLLGPGGSRPLWFVLSVGFGLLLIWAARTAWLRGQRLDAVVLTGLAGLLASPISWTHHWVWVPLIALVLWYRGQRVWATCGMLIAATWVPWLAPHDHHREFDWNGWQFLIGDAYILYGLVSAVLLGYLVLTDRRAYSPITSGISCATM